jgi:hypothetical protein
MSTNVEGQFISPNDAKPNVGSSIWSEKYELHIGKAYNLETKMEDAKFKIIVTKEQMQVIEHFADIEMDAELNKTYILNKCRFKVVPHFDFKGS